jgi:putative ABC transport system substrate-binding protein
MGIADDAEGRLRLAALYKALHELGWVKDKNLEVEEHWGAGNEAGIEDSVAELLRFKPNVIFVNGARALTILEKHNNAIPVVMVATNNPDGGGFDGSLARPATNVTGFTNFELPLLGKMLAQLVQAAPGTKRIGLLVSPKNPNADAYFRTLKSIELDFHLRAVQLYPSEAHEIDSTIALFSRESAGALILPPDVFVVANRAHILAIATAHKLPTIGAYHSFAAEGGLMAYGANLPDLYRRAANYVSRLLNGEDAHDLPIQAPIKYDLVINLGVAKTLGLRMPQTLVALADEVIE